MNFRVSAHMDKIQKMNVRRMLTPFRQLLTIQQNPSADLVAFDNQSWRFLSETSKLVSNTASFSFVVNVDGIKTLEEQDTLPFTLAALAEMIGDESPDEIILVQVEVRQASLARTILPSVKRNFRLLRERC